MTLPLERMAEFRRQQGHRCRGAGRGGSRAANPRGTARIVCGEDILTRTANQSVYIPIGTTHRLENPGKLPLEIIEVQSGAYLGEDDIVRFEDAYGR